MPRQKRIPQRLKKLESTDYIQVRDNSGNILVVTKQETNAVIREMLEHEYELASNRAISKIERKIANLVESKFSTFERDAEAFINHRIDQLAEKVCDMLIMRKFKDEVEKRAEELLIKKQLKGKF